jgi:hypothetical protein
MRLIEKVRRPNIQLIAGAAKIPLFFQLLKCAPYGTIQTIERCGGG